MQRYTCKIDELTSYSVVTCACKNFQICMQLYMAIVCVRVILQLVKKNYLLQLLYVSAIACLAQTRKNHGPRVWTP